MHYWISKNPSNDNDLATLRNKNEGKGLKIALITLKNSRDNLLKEIAQKADSDVNSLQPSNSMAKLLCSLLFWAEGGKNLSSLRFTNSDPSMVRVFLYLLRNSFPIDENRLRVTLQLHMYHHEQKEKEFWMKVTGIPLGLFHKTYIKPNTGKRIKQGYHGCVSISYYDYKVAHELESTYNAFTEKVLGPW